MYEQATAWRQFAPDIVHGFTTRQGGVSVGRYASLNLGRRWGDDPAAVETNLARVAADAGFVPEALVTARQVHGVHVVRACEVAESTEADALWLQRGDCGGRVVGVFTADCVPVLLVDRQCRVAAAVHSGWRGTAANIVARTVETLTARDIAAADLLAAIGPCIGLDAFEVGPEVADAFDDRFVRRTDARPHVDLRGVVREQLRTAGLHDTSIEDVGRCTFSASDRYYSYRRDGAGTGQQLSFVGFR